MDIEKLKVTAHSLVWVSGDENKNAEVILNIIRKILHDSRMNLSQ